MPEMETRISSTANITLDILDAPKENLIVLEGAAAAQALEKLGVAVSDPSRFCVIGYPGKMEDCDGQVYGRSWLVRPLTTRPRADA